MFRTRLEEVNLEVEVDLKNAAAVRPPLDLERGGEKVTGHGGRGQEKRNTAIVRPTRSERIVDRSIALYHEIDLEHNRANKDFVIYPLYIQVYRTVNRCSIVVGKVGPFRTFRTENKCGRQTPPANR